VQAGAIEVLPRYLLAADEHLTVDARAGRGSVRPADLDLDAGERASGGAQPAAPGGIAGREAAVITGAEYGDGRACLGEAVGVDEIDMGQEAQGRLDGPGGHPPAPVGQVAEGRQAIPVCQED